jgi:hypothetical protein
MDHPRWLRISRAHTVLLGETKVLAHLYCLFKLIQFILYYIKIIHFGVQILKKLYVS